MGEEHEILKMGRVREEPVANATYGNLSDFKFERFRGFLVFSQFSKIFKVIAFMSSTKIHQLTRNI